MFTHLQRVVLAGRAGGPDLKLVAQPTRQEPEGLANPHISEQKGAGSSPAGRANIHRALDFQAHRQYFWNVALTVEMVAQEALGLPTSGRALLVERLLASLAGETNPAVERAHLDEIRERRAAVRSGKASLVDGTEGLRQVRAALRR